MTNCANNRAQEFRDHLSRRVLVADGAMGTMLYSRGVFINRCFDELNLSSPDMVRQIHQEYVKAGAEILETNTFGANRMRLAAFGLAEKLKAINQAGVRLAREAAREAAFVAGAVGPLGVRIEPLGPTSFAEARAIFREQIDALSGSRRRSADPRNFRQPGRTARSRPAPRARPPAAKSPSSRRSPSTISATCPAAPIPKPSPARWIPGRWT